MRVSNRRACSGPTELIRSCRKAASAAVCSNTIRRSPSQIAPLSGAKRSKRRRSASEGYFRLGSTAPPKRGHGPVESRYYRSGPLGASMLGGDGRLSSFDELTSTRLLYIVKFCVQSSKELLLL